MKNILITGGAGFIGSHLAYFLSKKEYNITILDDLSHGFLENLNTFGNNYYTFIKKDITKNIDKYLKNQDAVFHLAAISSLPECQENPSKAIEINLKGTENVLETCRKHKIKKVIFASTGAIYENTHNNKKNPLFEECFKTPNLIYPLTKLWAEQLCQSYVKNYNMDIIIPRFFNVYGGNQNSIRKSPPLTIYLIKKILAKEIPQLHSDGKQKRDYVHINDINQILLKMLKNNKISGETINVCTGKTYSVRNIVKIIKELLDSDIQEKYNPSENLWANYNLYTGFPLKKEIIDDEVNKHAIGDYSKAKNLLNWKPKVSFKKGIQKAINSYINKESKNA